MINTSKEKNQSREESHVIVIKFTMQRIIGNDLVMDRDGNMETKRMAKVKGLGTIGVPVKGVVVLWCGDMLKSFRKEAYECLFTTTSNDSIGIAGKMVKDFKDI